MANHNGLLEYFNNFVTLIVLKGFLDTNYKNR